MNYLKTYLLFLEESKNDFSPEDILKELTLPLTDEGLQVEIGWDNRKFRNKFVVAISDDYGKFCKEYPKNDMDWLFGKPIINNFLQDLEDFGLKRGKDFIIYGGGTGVNIVFNNLNNVKLESLSNPSFKHIFENNKIDAEIPLPDDIIKISNAYIKAGKDIFLVGGAVRDFIQGIKPKDYDLVTNALPDESKKILRGFNISDEQGKNFGVLRIYTKDEPEGYEIASYRRDISGGRDTKGDDQKVEMGDTVTIEDDCKRRDLTMNALFYDIKNKQIVDLVGGVDDIKNGIVRSVGDAAQRFNEDRLRICRIFRFAARTGGEIDGKTSMAIKNDNRLRSIGPKDDVSQERIWEEIKKAFDQSKDYNQYLSFFNEFKMWPQVFPDSKINTNLIESKDFVVIIANLFKNENVSIRTTNSTISLYDKMVRNYKIESDLASKVIFLLNLLKFKIDDVFDMYKKKIQSNISDSTILEWIKVMDLPHEVIKFIDYKPSVSAEELMNKGFKGAELGNEIRRLEIKKFKSIL